MMHSMGLQTPSFQTHIALALQLIALVSGILLINKASSPDFCCKKTGKIVGGFVAIVSILAILCIGYLGIKRCYLHEKRMVPPMMSPGWQHPPLDTPMGMPSEPGDRLPKSGGEK